jgi:hypothetical protein
VVKTSVSGSGKEASVLEVTGYGWLSQIFILSQKKLFHKKLLSYPRKNGLREGNFSTPILPQTSTIKRIFWVRRLRAYPKSPTIVFDEELICCEKQPERYLGFIQLA